MYSQYQQYQPQPATSSRQWNGVAWVSPTTAVSSSTHSTYNSTETSPNQVQQYTQYYHDWQAHGRQCQQDLNNSKTPTERTELQRQVDWAKYYADESSRAAHHFYQTPTATPSFQLPPAPPKLRSATTPATTTSSTTAAPAAATTTSVPSTTSKGSLTRFVQRCLDQCSTDTQRQQVQGHIERVIAQAIQQGNMHTKNWDLEPALAIPGTAPHPPLHNHSQPSQPSQPSHYDSKLPVNQSYYGHSKSPKRKTANKSSDNYYGPASSCSDTTHPSPSYLQSNKRSVSPEEIRAAKKAKGFATSSRVLAQRANRFSGPGGIQEATQSSNLRHADDSRYMGKSLIGGDSTTLQEEDYERMTVKGTSTTLEKEYLRLTAPPRAELVRPQPILERHLANLQASYKKRDYVWYCSQFKAIRQDCTVQRIQNGFAIQVYETHARMALQEGDLNEYNQCQTQLKELYQQNDRGLSHQEEFLAYRILYYVLLGTNDSYEGGSSDLFHILLSLTPAQKQNPAIAHALTVREAVASTNYVTFWKLHRQSPNLGRCLTDQMVPTIRLRALKRMTKAYRPSMEITVCLQQLGFDTDKEGEQGMEYLQSCGCVLKDTMFLTKDSVIREAPVEKKNSLI